MIRSQLIIVVLLSFLPPSRFGHLVQVHFPESPRLPKKATPAILTFNDPGFTPQISRDYLHADTRGLINPLRRKGGGHSVL